MSEKNSAVERNEIIEIFNFASFSLFSGLTVDTCGTLEETH
jgi:hypothetical protein